ncbi:MULTISPECIES: SRPBCC family protein [unclassified Lysobacter]|uniref:SRPBCC family protein n=1 Tax=unclassified Lysobacter TaxID=2635362 RepID=UPI0006FD32B2|nr:MULTISPECIES: SRPBCC family protein [unclassified Lysobacter]KRC33680.1 ATPase [Lysobacter sp. Root76]KRD69017.1 ATPase [Lysobacter sp. Root96]
MSDYGVVTAADTVRIERLMPGPIERLWSYLTESEKRRSWMAAGEIELRPGGRVEHLFRNAELTNDDPTPAKYAAYEEHRSEGRVIDCDPPHRLSYTWDGDSEVVFELIPKNDRVLLVVTHRRLPDRAEMVSVAGGWHSHLDLLQDLLEGRKPSHFWSKHLQIEAEYERRIPQD